MKIISGIWKVKPEFINEFIDISIEAVALSSAEEGNVTFIFSQYKTSNNTFLFFEEWQDQDAIDFHISQDYFKTFMEKTSTMIESKPLMRIYDVSNQKEL